MKFGPIKNNHMRSYLDGLGRIRPRGGNLKKSVIIGLMLTSLVDVFSILVIYLLANTTTSPHEVDLNREIKLPYAMTSNAVRPAVSIKILNGKFIIDDKTFSFSELTEELTNLNQSLKEENDPRTGVLLVQADQSMEFEKLNPLFLAASRAGFESIEFATLEGKGS